jgi:glycosyltransferase involved in cell wall biosynthesis
MNILVAGGCDIPPPYGGLAGRILNNAVIWEREHNVHILLRWTKPKPDLLGARQTRLHFIYPEQPQERNAKLRVFLRHRLLGALRALVTKPALSLAVLRELPLLLTGTLRKGYHVAGAVCDSLTYAAALDDLIRRERIEVIQAHYARQDSLLCEIVGARHNVPVVVLTYAEAVCWPEEGEVITPENLYGVMPEWDPLFRRTFTGAAHVCTPSAHCAHGPKRFVPEEKITVTYACIDTAALQQYRERRAEHARALGVADQKVVLYVGQLTPRKGPQFLAQAAPKVLAAEPNARIVFIGSDINGYRAELERLTAGLGDRVLFTGGVKNEVLRQWYAVADALAFPTYTERECMGMSMKEAMAVGTPVVAFNTGGTPEAVVDGETGYLVEVGNADALADALIKVLRGDLGPEARQKCRERAVRLFDIHSGAALEYRILADAVAAARGRPALALQRVG